MIFKIINYSISANERICEVICAAEVIAQI